MRNMLKAKLVTLWRIFANALRVVADLLGVSGGGYVSSATTSLPNEIAGFEMKTKDATEDLVELIHIVEKWGWVIVMPKNGEKGITGMIIGTQEFIDTIMDDGSDRFILIPEAPPH